MTTHVTHDGRAYDISLVNVNGETHVSFQRTNAGKLQTGPVRVALPIFSAAMREVEGTMDIVESEVVYRVLRSKDSPVPAEWDAGVRAGVRAAMREMGYN